MAAPTPSSKERTSGTPPPHPYMDVQGAPLSRFILFIGILGAGLILALLYARAATASRRRLFRQTEAKALAEAVGRAIILDEPPLTHADLARAVLMVPSDKHAAYIVDGSSGTVLMDNWGFSSRAVAVEGRSGGGSSRLADALRGDGGTLGDEDGEVVSKRVLSAGSRGGAFVATPASAVYVMPSSGGLLVLVTEDPPRATLRAITAERHRLQLEHQVAKARSAVKTALFSSGSAVGYGGKERAPSSVPPPQQSAGSSCIGDARSTSCAPLAAAADSTDGPVFMRLKSDADIAAEEPVHDFSDLL